jgi:hypothetical protein
MRCHTLRLLLLVCLGLLIGLAACARTQTWRSERAESADAAPAVQDDQYWWYCRFKIDWPPGTDPDMSFDLLLADAVVAPVLRQHRQAIAYWRFHRRAVRDPAGHQFSFIFYTDPGAATKVMADLHRSEILQRALSEQRLEQVNCDDPARPARPNVSDTSDPNWSDEIRKNWPAYIMGVSDSWLGLIADAMRNTQAGADLQTLVDQYRQAHEAITALWTREGQHAFIHHLSAIFGYEPLLIQQEIRF